MKNIAQEIVESIQILIDNAMKKVTRVSGGVITSTNYDKTYSVKIKGKINTLPSYPKGQSISVGDTVFVLTPQGENNQAFIIPNSFNKLNDNMYINNNKVNFQTTPSSDITGNGVIINDVNNNKIAQISPVSLSTGEDGIEILVQKDINGTIYSNSMGLYIDNSGNKIIKISDPNAWKSALEIQ